MERNDIITARDIAQTGMSAGGDGYCAQGMKTFCKKHGIDWKDFVFNGIKRSELEKYSDDIMVQRILAEHDG